MKKVLIFLLASMALNLVACGNKMSGGSGRDSVTIDSMADTVIDKHSETYIRRRAIRADTHVANGAMLYDAAKIAPLFQLEIGLPGNSFAFELARKMRLPESIVKDAETRAGEEFVGIERNLRKIARNRRALDEKLQKIKHTDKALEGITERYEKELEDIRQQKKAILDEARLEAEQIVRGAGKQVEKTIRDIKEAQAEKEQTKAARQELQGFLRGG